MIVPISIREANRYIARWHRHARPVKGGLCAIAAKYVDAIDFCGVAILGRPTAKALQADGLTCEVTRLATDVDDRRPTSFIPTHATSVCSFLYARCRRIAQALGYRRCVTYTLKRESGASLRAIGLEDAGAVAVRAQDWDRPSRSRSTKHAIEPRQRWTLFE